MPAVDEIAEHYDVAQDMAEYVGLIERARADRDRADYLAGFIRSALNASGKKTLKIGDIEAKLKPNTVLQCLCHCEDVRGCATAKAGGEVNCAEVIVDEYLSVKRVGDKPKLAVVQNIRDDAGTVSA